ncbi:hypothetical protein SAY87_006513 [Trapa incisa]|uniref:Protein MIS12 homolog n=1 Tax=Trapa incisa TaxID=236973 RepID=A0AAN7JYS6_9MYRT|nr:hypothetical protein SAY87_006513 [Trapa incisa]
MESGGEIHHPVFESLKLNPQLFINEVLNTVDDLLHDALNFYHQQASASLKIEGSNREHDLSKGVACLHNMIQSVVDSHLEMWEKYCLHHCFKVPEGFSLNMNDELPDGSSNFQNSLMDTHLDTQLETLRNKLSQVNKESAELSQELQTLERQAVSSDHSRKIVNEVLQIWEHSSMNEIFQDLMGTADEIRLKIGNLKAKRMEEKGIRYTKDLKIGHLNKDLPLINHSTGLHAVDLEDLQKLLSDLQ